MAHGFPGFPPHGTTPSETSSEFSSRTSAPCIVIMSALLVLMLCMVVMASVSQVLALGAGQAVLWTPAAGSQVFPSTKYHTATMQTHDLPAYVKQHVSGREGCLVVLLHGAEEKEGVRQSALSVPAVVKSAHASYDAVMLNAIYQSSSAQKASSASPAADALRSGVGTSSSVGSQSRQVRTMQDLQLLLEARRAQAGSPRAHVEEMVEVAVGAADADAVQAVHATISSGNAGSVLLVAVVEPTDTAPAARAAAYGTATPAAAAVQAKIQRRVASSSSSETQTPEYRPSGTEFSIYHSQDYLYITPDIFTAIMTVAFIAVTMYLGLSCVDSIQGASSWTDEKSVPPIGKEA